MRRFIRLAILSSLLVAWGSTLSGLPRLVSAQELSKSPVLAGYESSVAVGWMQFMLDRVRGESLTPPVAARVLGYAGVTLYEATYHGIPNAESLPLNGMPLMPRPDANTLYDWPTVAHAALSVVMPEVFPNASGPTRAAFAAKRDQEIDSRRQKVPPDVIDASIAFGDVTGRVLLTWIATDNFQATRWMRHYVPTGDKAYWRPLPGQTALEPYWANVRPFVLQMANDCDVPLEVPFSTDPNSAFYRAATEVKSAVDGLNDEQKSIADFWADTPGTVTPAGHWVSVANQIIAAYRQVRMDRAVKTYALLGVALHDAFISAWESKYRYYLLRPEDYITMHMDAKWRPYVPTPPFPEYPSGHSVASAAAAEVLTEVFGTLEFPDASNNARLMPTRTFTSFRAAAQEAAISRLYGGIHYRFAIANGLVQGSCVGRAVIQRLPLP